ncbi:hypothetical protein [Salinicoccus roseus]|uniref:hypothetical protein n=1 Tax=Salinicoccus roseus TaxID=45670 RepID=UPI001EF4A439|nr:hypothetical protein [Salinicoccus roseus]MCG7333555.1 hypothetical protein [Salinicoccus roseus]
MSASDSAPTPRYKHKNLTAHDLWETLERVFHRSLTDDAKMVIRFDEDYNIDPGETIEKLKAAGYKVERHLHYDMYDKIRISLSQPES